MNWNKSVTRSELLCGMVVLLGLLFMIGHGMGAASAAELPSSLEGVPGTISYQGTLTTALGEPVNGTVAMTFRLYSVPTGGSALWTETRTGGNAVPVSSGLFHVQLGSLTPISESILRTETLYLGVQIASDSEMTPREVVGAVPMAMTVPDGAVTSSKLSPSWYEATSLAKVSTTSTTPVSTGVSTAFECDVACTALILHRALVQSTVQDGVVYVLVLVDGARAFGEVGVSNVGSTVQGEYVRSFASVDGFDFVNLDAGSHTVEVQFFCHPETAGTCFYYGETSATTGDWEHLNVLVFAQP